MKNLILLIVLFLFTAFQSKAQTDQTWIDLDGSNDFLDFGTDSILAGKTQFTVEMRVHFDNSTGDYTVLGQRNSDNNRTIVLQRWAGAFYVFLSNINYGSCSFIPCEALIYHLAIVYDGNGVSNADRLKLYINGELQVLTFTGTVDPASYITSPAANLVLGCEHNGPSTQLQYVDGQFGEFCVWDYPLTPPEINNRIAPEVVGNEIGLVEYFHFDNGTPGGINTSITSFSGGNGLSTITPTNLAMNGFSSNFISEPILTNIIDTSVTVADPVITANALGVTYQWLDCDNSNAIIPGQTFQNYIATSNGNYAVQLTQGACVDTSACVQILSLGISNIQTGSVSFYPNPVRNELTIENKGYNEKINFEILNSLGKVVLIDEVFEKTIVQTSDFAPGIYLFKIKGRNTVELHKFIKD